MAETLEFYPTPAWQTRVLLHYVDIRGVVLEPCAGDGAIARLLEDRPFTTVHRNDLAVYTPPSLFAVDPEVAAIRVQTLRDATDPAFWREWRVQGVDWIVTNPPFSRAPEILPLAKEAARDGVAMLLRLSYLEPAENRARWLTTHPPSRLIFMPRASYVVGAESKTDQVGTMWAIWYRRGGLGTQLTWVPDRAPFERPQRPAYESAES